ncbi:MAG: AlwI family type II restriction endonuclease, partial [Victivallales bacterium]|nr:AlwI family type II restriction endonuclease [Victivallales bacterium]
IEDATLIKSNSPVGDDNEPIYTAPANVPDIECLYDNFVAICEVTMLTSRDQWYNEGQPVMRHLRDFENINTKPAYCLFIAPSLHEDTIETFFMSVKMYYKGEPQKIIPINISQFERVLKVVKHCSHSGRPIKHTKVKELYDSCSDVTNITDSRRWLEHIEKSLLEWEARMNEIQGAE